MRGARGSALITQEAKLRVELGLFESVRRYRPPALLSVISLAMFAGTSS